MFNLHFFPPSEKAAALFLPYAGIKNTEKPAALTFYCCSAIISYLYK